MPEFIDEMGSCFSKRRWSWGTKTTLDSTSTTTPTPSPNQPETKPKTGALSSPDIWTPQSSIGSLNYDFTDLAPHETELSTSARMSEKSRARGDSGISMVSVRNASSPRKSQSPETWLSSSDSDSCSNPPRVLGFKLDQQLELVITPLSLQEMETLTPEEVRRLTGQVTTMPGLEHGPRNRAADKMFGGMAEIWDSFYSVAKITRDGIPAYTDLLIHDINDMVRLWTEILRAKEVGEPEERVREGHNALDEMKMRKWHQSINHPDGSDDTWDDSPSWSGWIERDADYQGEWRREMRINNIETGLTKHWRKHMYL